MSSEINDSHPLAPGIYVVATPLGNLGDLSPRASDVLQHADLVAAEDTRTSRKLPPLAGTSQKLVSLTEHNFEVRKRLLLDTARTAVVAVISDAGTPGIADPGGRLVAAAHDEGIRVVPVPGPSVLSTALSVAGCGPGPAVFLGFLPRQVSKRRAALARIQNGWLESAVFLESPGRIAETLGDVAAVLNDPLVVVCREATKFHEEIVRGSASDLAARFAEARGEFTVVILVPPMPEPDPDAAHLAEYMAEMQRAGAHRGGAAAEAAKRFGVPRSQAYALWLPNDTVVE